MTLRPVLYACVKTSVESLRLEEVEEEEKEEEVIVMWRRRTHCCWCWWESERASARERDFIFGDQTQQLPPLPSWSSLFLFNIVFVLHRNLTTQLAVSGTGDHSPAEDNEGIWRLESSLAQSLWPAVPLTDTGGFSLSLTRRRDIETGQRRSGEDGTFFGKNTRRHSFFLPRKWRETELFMRQRVWANRLIPLATPLAPSFPYKWDAGRWGWAYLYKKCGRVLYCLVKKGD